MEPAQPPLPTAWNFPFQFASGIHTSILISESLDGFSVAATLQNAGSCLKIAFCCAVTWPCAGSENSPAHNGLRQRNRRVLQGQRFQAFACRYCMRLRCHQQNGQWTEGQASQVHRLASDCAEVLAYWATSYHGTGRRSVRRRSSRWRRCTRSGCDQTILEELGQLRGWSSRTVRPIAS